MIQYKRKPPTAVVRLTGFCASWSLCHAARVWNGIHRISSKQWNLARFSL